MNNPFGRVFKNPLGIKLDSVKCDKGINGSVMLKTTDKLKIRKV